MKNFGSLECSGNMNPIEIDGKLESRNHTVRSLASKIFPAARKKPRKSWMTEVTWSIVKRIAPTRRKLFNIRTAHRRLLLGAYVGNADTIDALSQAYSCEGRQWQQILHSLQCTARYYIRFDKRNHLEAMANKPPLQLSKTISLVRIRLFGL